MSAGVRVGASGADRSVVLVGHGIRLQAPFRLTDDITILPDPLRPSAEEAAAGCASFGDYAAVLSGVEIASFCVEVRHDEGGDALAVKGWNALWMFHILSLAARAPCFPLYAVGGEDRRTFSSANRSAFIRPASEVVEVAEAKLEWAKHHLDAFDSLVGNQQFRAALLCFTNAHYLPDLDVRVMLLWAGIEGLLSVDAELNRRLALYAALLLDGTPEEKAQQFDFVKKAYSFRSRVVHGGRVDGHKLRDGYANSVSILVGLLARCVELGRVPTPDELDRAAVANTIR